MTHFWAAGSPVVDNVTMRYYVDNETEASIEFVASFATGVGFDDQEAYVFFVSHFHAPISSINSKCILEPQTLGYEMDGQRCKDDGMVPQFSHSVLYDSCDVSARESDRSGFSHDLDDRERYPEGMKNFQIGDVVCPQTARMKLIKTDTTLDPLEFVDLINLKSGTRGMLFQSTLQVESSQNFNFMEGCSTSMTTSTPRFRVCFCLREWRITTTLRFTLMVVTFTLPWLVRVTKHRTAM